jgi:hypothetical protein
MNIIMINIMINLMTDLIMNLMTNTTKSGLSQPRPHDYPLSIYIYSSIYIFKYVYIYA